MSNTETTVRRTRRSSSDMERPWTNNLRQARLALGKTQAEVASAIDVAQSTLAAMELGTLSGRPVMDRFVAYYQKDPEYLFPYYNWVMVTEAARQAGVSTTTVSRRVKNNTIPSKTFGNVRMIHVSDVPSLMLPERHNRLAVAKQAIISNTTGGLTTGELLNLFTYSSDEERLRTMRSLQQLLSRNKDFVSDRSSGQYRWRYLPSLSEVS